MLLYGPDAGIVRERTEALIRRVAGDPGDAFRVVEITADLVGDDPARLADEAAAMPLFGGRRVVRLRGGRDELTEFLEPLLADPGPAALIVIEAGELRSRSSLRLLCESHGNAAAVACYRDEEQDVARLVESGLAQQGIAIEAEALEYVAGHLGSDRALTRAEIEKLVLYAGPAARGRISLADARAAIGDSAWIDLDDLVFAVAEGGMAALDRALERSLLEGVAAVRILRAAAQHFLKLHRLSGLMAAGQSAERAVASLRPPVFSRDRPRLQRQAERWSGDDLGRALARLLEAEEACKRTGAPDELLCSRALVEIAGRARRTQRAPMPTPGS
ncbi:MAG: DNA polymerase III subunit delta [Steroidobacteraceae bacterium]